MYDPSLTWRRIFGDGSRRDEKRHDTHLRDRRRRASSPSIEGEDAQSEGNRYGR
jgi:hypothetical protein